MMRLYISRVSYEQDRLRDKLFKRWTVFQRDPNGPSMYNLSGELPDTTLGFTKRGTLRKASRYYNRKNSKTLCIQDPVTKRWRVATREENVEAVLTK